jgi:hypothetical protein
MNADAALAGNVSGVIKGVLTLDISEVSELRLGELGERDGVRVMEAVLAVLKGFICLESVIFFLFLFFFVPAQTKHKPYEGFSLFHL